MRTASIGSKYYTAKSDFTERGSPRIIGGKGTAKLEVYIRKLFGEIDGLDLTSGTAARVSKRNRRAGMLPRYIAKEWRAVVFAVSSM